MHLPKTAGSRTRAGLTVAAVGALLFSLTGTTGVSASPTAPPTPRADSDIQLVSITDYLPPTARSAAAAVTVSSRQRKKLLRRIKAAKPSNNVTCTDTVCITYTYVLNPTCRTRILKRGRMVCKPWRRVESQRVDLNPGGQNPDPEPSTYPTPTPSPTVPTPGPGAVFFTPGVNAIPDLGVPTGNPADYTYLFAVGADGTPKRYGRCSQPAIYVRVNYDTVPAGHLTDARTMLSRALQAVADKTGYQMVLQGTTTNGFDPDLAANTHDDTDLWISFYESDPNTFVLGRGGGVTSGDDLIGGYVQVRSNPPGQTTTASWYQTLEYGGLYTTLLHEISHSVGLGHAYMGDTPENVQIMFPLSSPMPYTQFQAGDRTGLRNVGTGYCPS